jgi:hypothetical protein
MADNEQIELRVSFESLGIAAANQAAAELRQQLRRAVGGDVSINIVKERSDTQDFGATLVLVLGTPAAIAVAKGIRDFIAKRGDSIVIQKDGTVIARGEAAAKIDAAAIVAARSQGRK